MEKIFIKEVEGFKIYFEECEEFEAVENMLSFELTGVDHSDTIEKVNNNEYAYFTAKVTAEKNGIELSSDYLGGCIYDTVDDFYKNTEEDYISDMIDTVITEAKETIKGLCHE